MFAGLPTTNTLTSRLATSFNALPCTVKIFAFSCNKSLRSIPGPRENGTYTRIEGLEVDAFSRERMDFTLNELLEERDGVKHLLP